jgi:chromosome partitioning protein
MQSPLSSSDPTTVEHLTELASRASAVVAELRNRMLLPDARKNAPTVSSDRLMQMTKLSAAQVKYRIEKGLPSGKVPSGRGGRREFTLEESSVWAKAERKEKLRPDGAKAATIAVAFFKGGVTKTTTSMVIAQGLSLLGHRVLNIDLDPQGSLTTLHGLLPDSEIDEEVTLGPLFHGTQSDVRYAIRKTYWDGIDLIPAASALFGAEFSLPSRQMRDRAFQFWNVLNAGLDPVRQDYDVIIIDTPPSLSYMTTNAFFAADGLVVPMMPSMLDLASSAQFWALVSDLASNISQAAGVQKTFDFVSILLSKVNNQESTTKAVREWIQTVYGGRVLPVEIPLTTVASSQVNQFSTAFDLSKYEGDSRTYKRARDAYEDLALTIEESLHQIWNRQIV